MRVNDLPPLRQVLDDHGLRADKRLGQHFLLDLNITDKIASLVTDISDKRLIEIGPGPGGLTRSVLAAGAVHVTAVEKDDRFIPILKSIGTASDNRLSIINADALKIVETEHVETPAVIISNLPYNVGTALLIKWLSASPLWWTQAVLMFQKEVAERVVARPGDTAYGRLAVLVDAIAEAHMAYYVPASAFTPPPKVDSAVVNLTPKAENARYSDLKTLGQITSAAFGQRRKMLRKSLKPLTSKMSIDLENWLATADIIPTQRPEEISPAQFRALADTFIQNSQ